MASTTVIAATTAQVTAKATFNAHGLTETVGAIAHGLAGSEKVYVWVGSSGGWTALFDQDVQVVITATSPQASLLPGMHYGFTKDSTVAAVSVDVISTR